MSLTYAAALTTLDTILGDSDNVTFTTTEKGWAMTRAWQDSYVVNVAWDTSLTYTTGTYQYTLPSTLNTIKDIYLAPTGSSSPFPEPIDNSLWELVNGKIQFRQSANSVIPSGYVLYLKGHYKLTVSDSITPVDLQEYVLALAGVYTVGMLGYKKANRFLKNDTTMAEIIGLKNNLQQDVIELRRRLVREFESA